MTSHEFAQLELLTQVDELVARLREWSARESPWHVVQRVRGLVRRLLPRLENLRVRLETPLVVATFGGTGTGKSSLVNALVGQECSTTGRQRPTTRRPVLLAHPDTELAAIGLPLEDFDVVTITSELLRDIVIIDCPDPDTSEEETTGSNLAILHQMLPYCDVLIYTSTQQKYRSARVLDELAQAATGCRLFFVQTHADLDDDIREDWRERLAEHYEVPEMFFVDSVRALQEQQAGQRPGGDFARLQDRLTTQLAASQRIRIRRANLIDMVHAVLEHSLQDLRGHAGSVRELQRGLDEQHDKLTTRMAAQLRDELMSSQNLWERRLLTAVTNIWGFSPFSSVLRFYNGLGSFIASFTFFRARNSAQMALVGAMQGTRWLKSRAAEREAETQLEQLATLGLDDAVLRESQMIIRGYAQEAGLQLRPELGTTLDTVRHEAVRVEDQFLGDAGRRIDEIIGRLAARNSGWFVRMGYECLFLTYLVFVLYRVGKNFFYDSFLAPLLEEAAAAPAEMLTVDFYIPAAIFFALWSGLLVMAFTRRLRKGLKREIDDMARSMASGRLAHGLYPALEQACEDFETDIRQLEAIAATATDIRQELATSSLLGSQVHPLNVAPAVAPLPERG